MDAITHELTFSGRLLVRGFWLYVWEIVTPEQNCLYYVGRTGDSSSFNAQSPFNRMTQHLGPRRESNALRRQLERRVVEPEKCSFRLVAYGPILEEAKAREQHRPRMKMMATMEKALADAMTAAGYEVMNTVTCRMPLDQLAFAQAREAFAEHFPMLAKRAAAGV